MTKAFNYRAGIDKLNKRVSGLAICLPRKLKKQTTASNSCQGRKIANKMSPRLFILTQQWNNLFFTDIICFNLTFLVNSSATDAAPPSRSGLTVVPFQGSGSVIYRSISSYTPSHIFYSSMQNFNFTVTLSCVKGKSSEPPGANFHLSLICNMLSGPVSSKV